MSHETGSSDLAAYTSVVEKFEPVADVVEDAIGLMFFAFLYVATPSPHRGHYRKHQGGHGHGGHH